MPVEPPAVDWGLLARPSEPAPAVPLAPSTHPARSRWLALALALLLVVLVVVLALALAAAPAHAPRPSPVYRGAPAPASSGTPGSSVARPT